MFSTGWSKTLKKMLYFLVVQKGGQKFNLILKGEELRKYENSKKP